MEGYDVIGSDDHKIGQVVGVQGDVLVVEGGFLRKTRRAVPKAFAHADDGERVVRLSVPKDVVEDGPDAEDGEVDRAAVAQYYGLAGDHPAPDTEGYGELIADDPARSAEEQGHRAGVESAAEQRARVREGESEAGPRGRQIIPSDPHDPL